LLVGRRRQWQPVMEQVSRMHRWVLEAEEILSGDFKKRPGLLPSASQETTLSNKEVAERFDGWCSELKALPVKRSLSPLELECLSHFLEITGNLRPHLIQCYDLAGLPRTNNDMEGYIRSLKTSYRRVSGRKKWGNYLLRYGRSIAYHTWLSREGFSYAELGNLVRRVTPADWQTMRRRDRAEAEEQLKRFRFRRDSAKFLAALNSRWEQILTCTT
jgi:hypothetical protein